MNLEYQYRPLSPMGRPKHIAMVDGFEEWLRWWDNEGRALYLLTLQLHHLNAPPALVMQILIAELERIYRLLVTRVHRNPQKAGIEELPVLFGCPDRPVAKRRATDRLSHITPNDGIHFHAIIGIPKNSRLQVPLAEHFFEHDNMYRNCGERVSRIHVQPITALSGHVVDYMFKHIKRRSFTLDDVLILPKTIGEL